LNLGTSVGYAIMHGTGKKKVGTAVVITRGVF
jgi:hypothetical protein